MSTSPQPRALLPLPRALLEDEWPALRRAVNEVFRPNGGDLMRECPLLFDRTNRENLRVIVDTPGAATALVLAHAGVVIWDALVSQHRLRVACVGAVFTATPMRGRGLASHVLDDALDRARQAADVVLVSGDRGLYRRHGLQAVPPMARFRMPGPSRTVSSVTVQVREASTADLSIMADLYHAENVHFVRSAMDWSRLWEARRLVDAPARFWIISRAGRAVAYAVTQQNGGGSAILAMAERLGITGPPRSGRILEIAGDRDSLLQAAPALAGELLIPWYDSATIDLCKRKGWPQESRQFPITAAAVTAKVPVIPWYGLNYV